MPYIQARAKYTGGNGKVVTIDSNSLNVIKNIPLSEWIIRVEASPIGTSNVATRTHFELSESVVVPHNSFVQIFPILRSEINKTQTGEGFHLAALRFTDTLVNGRSVKTIAYNEIFGTWKFATNILNIVSLNTDGTTYGTSPMNAVFNTYGVSIPCTIIRENTSIGDIGFYAHHWGSDAALQQRRIHQYFVGPKVTYAAGNNPASIDSYTRSGFSNGFKWEFTGGDSFGTPGGPAITSLLADTAVIFGDGTSVSQGLTLFIKVTRPNGDGVLHNSATIVFRNLRTNALHSFTFQRGVTYGTGGTYHINTSQFNDLRTRIAAIGTYGDRVEIESVVIN